MALAQPKVNQLMQRHEMKRRMEELRYQEELMEAQMEEEQAKVSFNIYTELANEHIGEYDNNMPGFNGNEIQGESDLSPLTETNAYEWESEFYTRYPPDLPSIQELSRTTQHLEQHEVYRPIVLEAGSVDWDYATLTMVRHPVVNYPILSHAVMEHTSYPSAFIPQTTTRSKRKRNEECKTSTTVLTRPVTKLCVLEMDGEIIPEQTAERV
ncbi:Hypothetical predicted protein [Paramuricea clavata]|uniref:Uncharacterized protein n=1 Tax=Paramuricea clavata TaxID=317549 RepID=A0A7D9DCU1_PARCT|nr:Hypothetical predicted protein [Paramuricea clavata]